MSTCTIHLYVRSARELTATISRIPYFTEKRIVLDSATVISVEKEITFILPFGEIDRAYQINISGTHHDIIIIPDSRNIVIDFNNANGKMDVKGSNATLGLYRLATYTDSLQAKAAELFRKDSGNLNKDSVFKLLADSINTSADDSYKRFADTVSNAAAFLVAYSRLSPEINFQNLFSIIKKAKIRFPKSSNIARLYHEAIITADIYSHEFNVGDKLPFITLPELNGNSFSTSSAAGKYYFLDFWSSWYPQCRDFNTYKKNLRNSVGIDSLQMISIALDDDEYGVNSIVRKENLNWIQLIDTGMWVGKAVSTFKFDSIPMNFLVAPGGTIIGKAIKQDTLVSFIRKKIRNS